MAIYSKTLSDKEILSLIPQNTKNILVVACGGCVNESLAYDNDIPILCNDLPFATSIEAERIANLLKENGFETEIVILDGDLPVLCIFTEDSGKKLLDIDFSPDVIFTISCKSGEIGLQLVSDKPVIAVTRQIGYISYTYKNEDGKRNIIKELSRQSIF